MKQIKLAQAQTFNLDAAPPGVAAQPAASASATSTSAPAGVTTLKSAPIPGMTAPTIVSNKNISRMQTEMLRIRSAFSIEDIAKNRLGAKPGLKRMPDGTADPEIIESLNRHHTGKIFSRHLANGPTPTSLSNILKSIDKAGTPANYKTMRPGKADGQWGDNTTAALNGIVSLANVMIPLSSKFGIQLQFTDNDISSLKKLIADHKQANAVAEQITEILIKIADSIPALIQTMDRTMSGITNPDELPAGYSEKGKDQEELKKQFPNINNIQLTSKTFKKPINLFYLSDKNLLIELLKEERPDIDSEDDNQLYAFLTSIEQGIKKRNIKVTNISAPAGPILPNNKSAIVPPNPFADK
jgi:hypothetical protein